MTSKEILEHQFTERADSFGLLCIQAFWLREIAYQLATQTEQAREFRMLADTIQAERVRLQQAEGELDAANQHVKILQESRSETGELIESAKAVLTYRRTEDFERLRRCVIAALKAQHG